MGDEVPEILNRVEVVYPRHQPRRELCWVSEGLLALITGLEAALLRPTPQVKLNDIDDGLDGLLFDELGNYVHLCREECQTVHHNVADEVDGLNIPLMNRHDEQIADIVHK